MKKNNKIVIALLIASVSTLVINDSQAYAKDELQADFAVAEENNKPENEDSEVEDLIKEFEDLNNEFNTNSKEEKNVSTYKTNVADVPEDDEVTFPKNEKNVRKSDGTNKFNRATETERETFGEDKNVVNIDESVSKKLKETNGEYGKKDGEYANNNLKANLDDIKDIVVNPGEDENQVAITWFAKGAVKESKLVFDGVDYPVIRARETGDDNSYSTYTAIVNIIPGNTYKYHVVSGDYVSAEYTLKTKALGENNSFSLAYFGDPQIGSGDSVWSSVGLDKNTQAKVDQDKIDFAKSIKKAMENDPHFYFSMGDNVEIANFEGEYDAFLDHPMFRERIFSSISGNHETYTDKNDSSQRNTAFSDHFYLANESDLGAVSKINEDGTKFYNPGDFYFSYGDTLFLNLTSNNIDSKEHEMFLEKAIAEATQKHGKNYSWKVVSFHHAPYSTATHTSDDDIIKRRSELVRIFNNNGIDLVLNGHDHIYTRTKQMVAGKQVLSLKEAYGDDIDHENAQIENGFSKTYNNKVYAGDKVIVDGIGLDYNNNKVVNPRGTLFLTMSTSAGSKYYNPIGEDQWFVNRSMDDRSQLFSNLSFSTNEFKLTTLDASGNIVDSYVIEKTNDFINKQAEKVESNKEELSKIVNLALDLKPIKNEDNIAIYDEAIKEANVILSDENASQEAIDKSLEVLKLRLSEVKFEAEAKDIAKVEAEKTSESKKLDKKESKKEDKK